MTPFEDIIGHERVKDGLLRAAGQGRIHHAWLFVGREGVGKTLLARRFAQMLICEKSQPGKGEDSLTICGECRHCRRFERALQSEEEGAIEQAHPDLTELYPSGMGIKIKQIRELQQTVSYNPFEARYRVVFIYDAHKLLDASANAFLKTLEEPTERTLFILITDQAQQLLPTIVSRCQLLRFAPFKPEEVRGFLVEQGITEERADLVSVLAEGSFGHAVRLVEEELESHVDLLEALEGVNPGDPVTVLDLAAQISDQRDQIPAILTLLRAYFRDLMLLRRGADTGRIALGWRLEQMQQRAKRLTPEDIESALEALSEIEESLAGNVNARLGIEWLVFELSASLHGAAPAG